MSSKYRQNVFVWSLYDFANSSFTTLVVTFIYATYFTEVIAENKISGTALWSRAVSFTAIFVAIASPIMGAIADKSDLRKTFLTIMTYISVFGSIMLYFTMPGEVIKALTWFVIANIGFELGGVFYNAYLPEIAFYKPQVQILPLKLYMKIEQPQLYPHSDTPLSMHEH